MFNSLVGRRKGFLASDNERQSGSADAYQNADHAKMYQHKMHTLPHGFYLQYYHKYVFCFSDSVVTARIPLTLLKRLRRSSYISHNLRSDPKTETPKHFPTCSCPNFISRSLFIHNLVLLLLPLLSHSHQFPHHQILLQEPLLPALQRLLLISIQVL